MPHGLARGRGDRPEKGDALKLAKLNIDDNPEATRTYGVMSIPSLILFKGGKEVARVVGAKPKDAILKDLQPHLEPQPASEVVPGSTRAVAAPRRAAETCSRAYLPSSTTTAQRSATSNSA